MTRDHTIESPTQDYATIRHEAGLCLKRVPLDRRLRLLGVRVGGLSRPDDDPAPSAGEGAQGMTGVNAELF